MLMKHLTAAGAVSPKPEHLVNWSGTHECRTQVGWGSHSSCACTAGGCALVTPTSPSCRLQRFHQPETQAELEATVKAAHEAGALDVWPVRLAAAIHARAIARLLSSPLLPCCLQPHAWFAQSALPLTAAEHAYRLSLCCHSAGRKLRCVGSGLSPNGLGFNEEGMVSLALMDRILKVDEQKQQVLRWCSRHMWMGGRDRNVEAIP